MSWKIELRYKIGSKWVFMTWELPHNEHTNLANAINYVLSMVRFAGPDDITCEVVRAALQYEEPVQ